MKQYKNVFITFVVTAVLIVCVGLQPGCKTTTQKDIDTSQAQVDEVVQAINTKIVTATEQGDTVQVAQLMTKRAEVQEAMHQIKQDWVDYANGEPDPEVSAWTNAVGGLIPAPYGAPLALGAGALGLALRSRKLRTSLASLAKTLELLKKDQVAGEIVTEAIARNAGEINKIQTPLAKAVVDDVQGKTSVPAIPFI